MPASKVIARNVTDKLSVISAGVVQLEVADDETMAADGLEVTSSTI